MPLKTDLNQSPYFDDYDEEKNFHRVLFKPAVAVQARELTQLQTILQNQVERFGENILKTGSIIKGGNFTEISPLPFVKIRDFDLAGNSLSVANYTGYTVTGATTGITAYIEKGVDGLETQLPDLTTLYIKYKKTNDSDEKTFSPTENLYIYDETQTLITTVTAAGVVDNNTIGEAYGVSCGDGVIYKDGFFVRFEDQITIVDEYDDNPDGVVVGFELKEEIINSDIDESLSDNAQGFNNFNAPGADRIKLTPILTKKTLAEARALPRFFTIQEYSSGNLVKRNLTTAFNSVEKFAEQRTFEESGNYVTDDFNLRVEENIDDANTLLLAVGTGTAYVGGKRLEIISDYRAIFDKELEFDTENSQDVVSRYGNYVIVEDLYGAVDFGQWPTISLRDTAHVDTNTPASAPGSELGTAIIKNIQKDVGNTYRVYLDNIKMTSNTATFSDVKSFFYEGGTYDSAGNLVLESSSASLKESSRKNMFSTLGREAIKEYDDTVSSYIYRTSLDTTAAANGQITLSLSGTEEFAYGISATLTAAEKQDIIVVMNESVGNTYVTGEIINLETETVTTDATGQTLTIQLGENLVSPRDITVYYNVKVESVKPRGKTLETVYVKIDATSNVKDRYTLGFPDVYSIDGIWTGNTYAEDQLNITGNFRLVTNQKDGFYDLSYITATSSTGITDGDNVLVKCKVFRENTSGAFSDTFFSVDSYPVDDVSSVLPDNKIRTQDIPSYRSTDGAEYRLRDVIDNRPYVANTATYSATIAGATTNPAGTSTFDSGNKYTPAIGKRSVFTYDYYVGRYDRIIVDAEGTFGFVSGDADEFPVPPPVKNPKNLTLAIMYVPPFPALPTRVANSIGKPEYGVTIRKRNVKNYTMQEVGELDQRVKNLEYYTLLNSLEKSATDYTVTDNAGLDRFKNGIFVDNFTDLMTADIQDAEFGVGLDKNRGEIHPKFRIFPIGLEVANTNNVVDWGEAVSFPKTDASLITQPYATLQRSCTTDFYKWSGDIQLNPEFDANVDTTRSPDVNIEIDLATPLTEFSDQLQEFLPALRPQTDTFTTDESSSRNSSWRGGGTWTTNVQTTTAISRSLEVNTTTQNQQYGDFVRDVTFSQFLQEREIDVYASGLKPNTRVWIYFDGVSVAEHTAPGVLNEDVDATNLSGPLINATADYSDTNVIRTTDSGELFAKFRLPAGKFYVGDRKLEIMDVSNLASRDAATTYAFKRYSGFNNTIEKVSLGTTTRVPQTTIERDVQTTRRVTRTFQADPPAVTVRRPPRAATRVDPIAQTFYVDSSYSNDTSVFVGKIDVYFAKKSTTSGVTLQIRDVINGYPGPNVMPFSSVRLAPEDVVASDTSASTPTTFTFKAPIPLEGDREYCFVLIPDGNDPDYRIWASKVGQSDIDTDETINQDTNSGTMFTSTNNKAWTAYQDENLKYTLYKSTFSQTSGYVEFTSGATEFLHIENVNKAFLGGEEVFVEGADLQGEISVTAGNTTITGTNTEFTTDFVASDYLIYRPTANTYQALVVDTVNSDTSLTVKQVPFVSNSAANYLSSVVGKVAYYHSSADPVVMVLEDSSAKTGSVFEANTTIIGTKSGSNADIVEVRDNPVSFMVPKIFRTNYTFTTTNMRNSSFYGSSTGGMYNKNCVFNEYNRFKNEPTYIKSRSNEIVDDAGAKSFILRVNMNNITTSGNIDTSPFIDHKVSGVDLYEYLVNDDLTGETGNAGSAKTKYVSQDLLLVDGFEAEDIRVILSAYRPNGTNIDVYTKFKSDYDPRNIDEMPWTKLLNTESTSLFSSPTNINDIREFEYLLPTVDPETTDFAWLNSDETIQYTNEDGTIYYDFKNYKIKIVLRAESHNLVPRVSDIRAICVS